MQLNEHARDLLEALEVFDAEDAAKWMEENHSTGNFNAFMIISAVRRYKQATDRIVPVQLPILWPEGTDFSAKKRLFVRHERVNGVYEYEYEHFHFDEGE